MRGRNTEFPRILLQDDHSLFSEVLKVPELFFLCIFPVPVRSTVPRYGLSVSVLSSHRFHQRRFSGIYLQLYCKDLCTLSRPQYIPELLLLLQTDLWNMQSMQYKSDHLVLHRNSCLLQHQELPSHRTEACSSRYNLQNILS